MHGTIRGLEKHVHVLSKELIEVKSKLENALTENAKLQEDDEALKMMISEANKVKREQLVIIQAYKEKYQQKDTQVLQAHR